MTQSFGQYLRQARESKSLTQQNVANKLGYTSAQFISNWERNESLPPPNTYKRLIKIYDLHVGEFIFKFKIQKEKELDEYLNKIFRTNKGEVFLNGSKRFGTWS